MDPRSTWWHEIHPNYCKWWHLTSWEDNQPLGEPGHGKLSPRDQIDMVEEGGAEKIWYHVDRMTIALNVTLESDPTQWMKIEMKTWLFEEMYEALKHPVNTLWHEVYPDYSNVYNLTWWDWLYDDNCNGVLDVCDYIWLMNPQSGIEERYHVEDVCYDIILNKKIMDPIGTQWHELYPSFSNHHQVTSWEEELDDPYPGRLSPNDQIDMYNATSGRTEWYHVDRVTLTLNVSIIFEPGIFYLFEFKGPFEDIYKVKTKPLGTNWTMVWPDYWPEIEYPPALLEGWEDNCNGVLDVCDNITLGGEYCHVEDLAIDLVLNKKIADPVCTYWDELYPTFGNQYHIVQWKDNLDGLLSPCDYVNLTLQPDGPTEEYHVENVTLTLLVSNTTGTETMYIEFEGGYAQMYQVKTSPLGSLWHEVYPDFGLGYELEGWQDNCNGVLSFCDLIDLRDSLTQKVTTWHIEGVHVDMVAKKEAEPVHDVAVTSVTPQFGAVPQGWPCPITVTVKNEGNFTETFDVDVKYDGAHVTTSPTTVNNLPSGTSKTLTFCWVTKNVPVGNYTITAYAHPVPNETDTADNTLVDGIVTIQAPSPPGFYWKEGFCDYAPSGMPDFDERQDAWNATGTWTYCSPTAVANSLWWFDSKYEPAQPPVLPPTISDGFPLVTSYNAGVWDDHDPQNVQPFIQHLAYLMDTDGQRTGIPHMGTYVNDSQAGITHYLSWSGVNPVGDVNGDGIVDKTDASIVNASMGSTPGTPGWDMRADIFPITLGWPGAADNLIDINDLALVTGNLNATGMFYEHTVNQPHFYYVEEEVERSQDVVLSIGFWYWNGEFWEYREELGHSVTVAGVNSEELKIGISDPIWDAFENGLIPQGRVPIPHAHVAPPPPYITHNDAALVSHDIYDVMNVTLTPGSPGRWILHLYPGGPGDPVAWPSIGWYAVVEDAVITSPLAVHDVAIVNVTTCRGATVIHENVTACINVTVTNEGDVTETFNATTYWNTTAIQTIQFTLPSAASNSTCFRWNTTGLTLYRNYTVSASAPPVPGEADTADNNFTDGTVQAVMVGDTNADRNVDLKDVFAVALAYGSYPGHPNWNPNLDINCDGTIDLKDYFATALNYGATYP
ncbi:hypothetical protein GWN63_04170 [Candidatus Bathyarchaeota archaeon]|nr:hypothetical protein [Candidatus Bathyarchaeota archaeon]NIR17442.1 hypothetical protein [Desulfobacterales bacterium]NIU81425.1 hypothetical protein [Candidatus Bathyarchaeota archaeon]NIV68234.1 hypothetical protein [Candidatus Bathyarchaeota archaeon]